MKNVFRMLGLLLAFAAAGCVSAQSATAPATDVVASDGPAIVITAKNMNAQSANVPVLNQKMGEEVLSVAKFVQEKLEKTGRKVDRKDFENASPQDIARTIQEAEAKPTRLIQIYWSATEKGHVYLNIASQPIAYRPGRVSFGADSGKKFEILGPGTYSRITAEEMATDFVRSQRQ